MSLDLPERIPLDVKLFADDASLISVGFDVLKSATDMNTLE